MTAIILLLVGAGVGYGFRGWIRRHIAIVGSELKPDLQKLHDKLTEMLPKLEADVKAEVQAILTKIKSVL
jgi:hypothetical protein